MPPARLLAKIFLMHHTSSAKCCSATAANSSWSGTDHQPGLRADAGKDRTFPRKPASGELPGTESVGAFQRDAAAAGSDQQARQSDVTQFVGGSGTERVPL